MVRDRAWHLPSKYGIAAMSSVEVTQRTVEIFQKRTFLLKIYCKMIKILLVGWPWYNTIASGLTTTASDKCWVVSLMILLFSTKIKHYWTIGKSENKAKNLIATPF